MEYVDREKGCSMVFALVYIIHAQWLCKFCCCRGKLSPRNNSERCGIQTHKKLGKIITHFPQGLPSSRVPF